MQIPQLPMFNPIHVTAQWPQHRSGGPSTGRLRPSMGLVVLLIMENGVDEHLGGTKAGNHDHDHEQSPPRPNDQDVVLPSQRGYLPPTDTISARHNGIANRPK